MCDLCGDANHKPLMKNEPMEPISPLPVSKELDWGSGAVPVDLNNPLALPGLCKQLTDQGFTVEFVFPVAHPLQPSQTLIYVLASRPHQKESS